MKGIPMRIGPCMLLLALSFAPALLSQSTSPQTKAPLARRPTAKSATATPDKPAAGATAAAATPAAPAACNCPTPTVQTQRHLPPYTAKQKITRVQTLANGTTITTVTTSQVWRDADGRIRQRYL